MSEENGAKRGRGRPPKPEDERLSGQLPAVRIAKVDLDRTRLAAALCDMDVSDYVRMALCEANKAHLPPDLS